MPPTNPERSPAPAEARLRIIAIAAGGSLGTLARYGVERGLAGPALGFPWPTLVVNVAGSFLLGALVTAMVERWPPSRYARPFAAIGFCGGFTTFSTLMVEVDQHAQHGRVGLAAAYVLISLVAGLLAAAAGMALARGRLLSAGGDGTFPDPDDMGALGDGPRWHPDGRST